MANELPTGVIDNTLLSRLVGLEIADFLPLVFSKILIPPEVRKEAFKAANRKELRNLFSEMKGFFVECRQDDFLVKAILNETLDEGEAAVIAQAEFTRSAAILDEKKAREEADKREIETIPTIRILFRLKEKGIIFAVKPYLDSLRRMGFHLKEGFYKELLVEANE